MSGDEEYEVYVEKFIIDEWRDGCIFRTASQGYGWFPKVEVDNNKPRETQVIYAAASDEFANSNMTIRVKK